MSWCCVSPPGVSQYSAVSRFLANSIHSGTDGDNSLENLETGDTLYFTLSKELNTVYGAVIVK